MHKEENVTCLLREHRFGGNILFYSNATPRRRETVAAIKITFRTSYDYA